MTLAALPDAWTEDAACTQIDVGDLWFPEQGASANAAIRICRHCPVRTACLEYALEQERNDPAAAFGVWGGYTASERRRMRKDRVCRGGCGTSIPLGGRGLSFYCDECRTTARRRSLASYQQRRVTR